MLAGMYDPGSAPICALERMVERCDLHKVWPGAGNEVSVAMHEKTGFKHIGVMREVGLKFGRRLDVILMQLILPEASGEKS